MAELEKLRVKALGLLNNCRDNIASKEASAAIRSQIVGILSDLKKYQGEEKSSLNEITEQIQAYIIEFMKDELKRLKSDAEAQIRICIDEKELQDTKVAFLGKRGKLTSILRGMKDLSESERPVMGALANTIRETVEKQFTEKLEELKAKKLEEKIRSEIVDITLPARHQRSGHIHPLDKALREIMKYIPAKKEKLHYSNFKDIVVFREEGRLTSLSASDFEDYRAKVNEYVEAHKTTPAINKLLHNEPISVEDYNELERIFTVELGTAEDYEMNYQDTPFGLLIRKIAKMDRTAAYAAFSTFILEERPNTEQLHFIEQVVDYVVENGYINNVLDLMKTPFDRPYKFSLIFTYEEQVKFVKIINNIKNNALVT